MKARITNEINVKEAVIMINFLAKLFIKDHENVEDVNVRGAYGVLCGAVGIVLNIILFGIKLFAGIISGSVAIVSNSLSVILVSVCNI